MLNFNSEHKSLKGSLKKNANKIKMRNVVLAGLALSSIFIFSGCAKKIKCDVEGLHIHKYVNEELFDKYVPGETDFFNTKEREYYGNWKRTDEYITLDSSKELYMFEFAYKNDLFRIDENQEKIKEITSTHKDYVEYRYEYTYVLAIPYQIKVGNIFVTNFNYSHRTGYSWTTDPNHSGLTGEQRVVHYMYYGCKIDEGFFNKIIESELVDSLDKIPEGYDYIKKEFYKKVDLKTKEEINYEDGPEEDKQLSEEQQAEYEEQLKEEQKSK